MAMTPGGKQASAVTPGGKEAPATPLTPAEQHAKAVFKHRAQYATPPASSSPDRPSPSSTAAAPLAAHTMHTAHAALAYATPRSSPLDTAPDAPVSEEPVLSKRRIDFDAAAAAGHADNDEEDNKSDATDDDDDDSENNRDGLCF